MIIMIAVNVTHCSLKLNRHKRFFSLWILQTWLNRNPPNRQDKDSTCLALFPASLSPPSSAWTLSDLRMEKNLPVLSPFIRNRLIWDGNGHAKGRSQVTCLGDDIYNKLFFFLILWFQPCQMYFKCGLQLVTSFPSNVWPFKLVLWTFSIAGFFKK